MPPLVTGLRRALALVVGMAAEGPAAAQEVPSPESVLGFVPGTAGRLAEWPVLVDFVTGHASLEPDVKLHILSRWAKQRLPEELDQQTLQTQIARDWYRRGFGLGVALLRLLWFEIA